MKMVTFSPGFKRYFLSTGWLLSERVFRSLLNVTVGVYVARYLGASDFGLLSYARSFVYLFSAFAALGLHNIVIRDLVQEKGKRDEILGTTLILRLFGSFLALCLIAFAVNFTNNDRFTNLLIFIIATRFFFRSFEVIDLYFRSEVTSKFSAYALIISGIAGAVLKLLFIFLGKGLIYFASMAMVENLIFAVALVVFYRRQKLKLWDWKPKFEMGKRLLKDSWPIMMTGLAVTLYMRIDQVMVKNLLGTVAVGNYAVAVTLAEVWYFMPMIITSSLFPAIVNARKVSEDLFFSRLQKLYDLMVWFALGIALFYTLFADQIVQLLFGSQYQASSGILKIYIWSGIAVFLGNAWSKWLLMENKQKFIFFSHTIILIANILLNFLLIKRIGITGAAWATLISYSLGQVIALLLYERKTNVRMALQILNPIKYFKHK
ncbi:flippase [Acidobacteriota bacterium]